MTQQRFPWGRVVDVHEIGPYTIREYHPRVVKSCVVTSAVDESVTQFHGYIDGEDCNESWRSLDDALAGLIVRRHLGPNCSAINECFMAGIRAMGGDE